MQVDQTLTRFCTHVRLDDRVFCFRYSSQLPRSYLQRSVLRVKIVYGGAFSRDVSHHQVFQSWWYY
jgi:hypothetical protein